MRARDPHMLAHSLTPRQVDAILAGSLIAVIRAQQTR
jgi:hypothetical protein